MIAYCSFFYSLLNSTTIVLLIIYSPTVTI
jgi:hypothetical protein